MDEQRPVDPPVPTSERRIKVNAALPSGRVAYIDVPLGLNDSEGLRLVEASLQAIVASRQAAQQGIVVAGPADLAALQVKRPPAGLVARQGRR